MSVSLHEYYNKGENSTQADNIVAKQITGRVGTTLSFADSESIAITDWPWLAQYNPQAGDWLALQGVTSSSPRVTFSAAAFADSFDVETNAHGGHEPVVVILD